MGWITVALLSSNFGDSFAQISISRGTGSYHGAMALILFVGYAYVIVHNLKAENENRIPILRLIFIGVLVQFSWEAVLLISGIRPLEWNPIVINSLLETNLGLPYLFFIHKTLTRRFNEDLSNEPEKELAVT
jgi:hypothetical protein